MTDRRTARLNFFVAACFLGIAAPVLLMIFGISQLMWYVAAGQSATGFAFWMLSFVVTVGCWYALYRIYRRLKAKMNVVA